MQKVVAAINRAIASIWWHIWKIQLYKLSIFIYSKFKWTIPLSLMFYYQQQIIASNSLILSWDLWSFVLEKDWRIIGKNCLMIDVVWTKLVESEKCLIWRPDFKTGANVAMKWSWIIFYIFPPNIIHNHRNTFCPLLLLLRHKIVAPWTRSDKISSNKIRLDQLS